LQSCQQLTPLSRKALQSRTTTHNPSTPDAMAHTTNTTTINIPKATAHNHAHPAAPASSTTTPATSNNHHTNTTSTTDTTTMTFPFPARLRGSVPDIVYKPLAGHVETIFEEVPGAFHCARRYWGPSLFDFPSKPRTCAMELFQQRFVVLFVFDKPGICALSNFDTRVSRYSSVGGCGVG
jgi:hypothetical protein